jgi:septum formation protein
MTPASWRIILGSSSKTRQAILRELGYDFDVLTADIDESAIRRESAEDLVLALAEAKAEAILAKLSNAQQHSDESSSRNLQTLVLLITADQVVLHQGLIL